MIFYAHTRDDGEFQLLKDHLMGVAQRCRGYAAPFNVGYLAYLSGILHDVGKYSSDFQQRIRGTAIRVDHSTAGAKWITESEATKAYLGNTLLDARLARLLAYAISGHHGGLRNFGTADEEGTLMHRITRKDVPDWGMAWREVEIQREDWTEDKKLIVSRWDQNNPAWSYAFLGRMLYSCLVDADSIDTRDFCNESKLVGTHHEAKLSSPSIQDLKRRCDDYLQDKTNAAAHTEINRWRQMILSTCRRAAESPPGIYSLTVPTGGGKTLSSMAFGLNHAVRFDKRRILYVIPFTSIIEQNAQQFRDALGTEAVLEHHSNFNLREYSENYGADEVRQLSLSAENWDAPVVVTTSVQFFESLFSCQRSKCRKLHNISDSVIIIDEAQSIPRGYITPCLQALEELIRGYGCSVVLCTATQPSWDGLGIAVTEIMDEPSPAELVKAFARVQVEIKDDLGEVTSDSDVADLMEQSHQVLCIVNTRKHARLLFDRLKERQVEGLFHLSARLCAKHRSDILKKVRAALSLKLPVKLISTQLIEAGVDIDFPFVLRAFAGLDSIAQAAGRCNREGLRDAGRVVVFYPEPHGMPSRGWLRETTTEARNTLLYCREPPLSLSSIRDYFERVHGIRDGRMEQVTDVEHIMALFKSKRLNFEIPYQEIDDRFSFIEDDMRTIVVPYVSDASKNGSDHQESELDRLTRELAVSESPMRVLRRLQQYTVQVYPHEYADFERKQLLKSVEGVLFLSDPSYYDAQAGLLSATEVPEAEILIF